MSITQRGTLITGTGNAAGPPALPAIAARFYGQRNAFGGTAATLLLVQDTLYGVPFTPPKDMAVDRVALNITGAAAGGKLLRIGLYAASAVTGLPGALLASGAAIAADATGLKTTTIDYKLRAGKLYWLACVTDGAPTVTSTIGARSLFGVDDAADSGGGASVTRVFTYAALPAAWGTVAAYVGPSPYLVLRAV